MEDKIRDFLKSINVGEQEYHKNIAYFPLKSKRSDLSYLTLEDAVTRNRVKIEDSGNVNSVRIMQTDSRDDCEGVMIMSGEAVKGGLQDRMITYDAFMDETTKKISVPANCIERGRWCTESSEGSTFFKELFFVPVSLRKINLVSRYLRQSSQQAVWDEIETKIRSTKTATSTSKLKSVLQHSREELKPLLDFFKYAKIDGNGFAVVLNSQEIYIDIFTSSMMFEKFFEKLATSYSLEALAQEADVKGEVSEMRVEKEQIQDFIENVGSKCLVKRDESYGNSKSYLYASNEAIGSAFLTNGIVRVDLFSISQLDRIKKQYFEDAVLVPVEQKTINREKQKETIHVERKISISKR